MKLRQLVTATGLYGIADMLVVGVSGFVLLPLYTRTLTQDQFGAYVVVRTGIEIFGYVLYLGLVSAIGRLYFDYRAKGIAREYINSVLFFFLFVFVLAIGALAIVGSQLWLFLSPTVPAFPYLWFTMALVGMGFLSQLGALWMRLETQVQRFVVTQVLAAASLAAAAWITLAELGHGLPGLMIALLVGNVPPAAVLLYRLGRRLRPWFDRNLVVPSLHYGVPFAVSYVAYFFLNRFSLVTLQHHVSLDDIAVFGLAQQVGMIIAIGSQSFGKAMQPAVYGASADDAPAVLHQSSKLFILLIFGVSAFMVLFAREVLWIVAPPEYHSGLRVVLVLLIGNFIYALSLVSSTALDYHRKPRVQAAIYCLGALVAVVLGLTLIPPFGLVGGAIATVGAYLTATLAGHVMAYHASGQQFAWEIAVTTIVLCLLAALASWSGWNELLLVGAVAAKAAILGLVLVLLLAAYAPQRLAQSIQWLRALSRPRA